MSLRERLSVLAASLWWGSLSVIGFVAVPMLFASAPTKALAGQLAARLFTAQAWVSLGCGLLLLACARDEEGTPSLHWARGALPWLLGGLLAACLVEFGVAPRIVARQDLAFWHSLGSGLYAAQWVCALVVLWKLTTRPAS